MQGPLSTLRPAGRGFSHRDPGSCNGTGSWASESRAGPSQAGVLSPLSPWGDRFTQEQPSLAGPQSHRWCWKPGRAVTAAWPGARRGWMAEGSAGGLLGTVNQTPPPPRPPRPVLQETQHRRWWPQGQHAARPGAPGLSFLGAENSCSPCVPILAPRGPTPATHQWLR